MTPKVFGMLATSVMVLLTGCQGPAPDSTASNQPTGATTTGGVIPEELEQVPPSYVDPSDRPGRLERLSYDTYESFSYEEKTRPITKTAWVYLPYGYTEAEKYNVFYLSHGGWSNETTLMGTPDDPHEFKHIVDNAIAAGRIKPLIIVLPTYNNTSEQDSSDYSLALQLTDNFHRELVNDLVPAVESKWSSYATSVTPEALEASRDHRGFGGFSMGSVNTWHTFEYSLDYFRYYLPMSGGLSSDGQALAERVAESGHSPQDFFIYAITGSDDFAYGGFDAQLKSMATQTDTFITASTEAGGNLAYRVREGYRHDPLAANEYTYNGLRFFWADAPTPAAAQAPTSSAAGAFGLDTPIKEVIADPTFNEYGRLIFPVDAGIPDGLRLAQTEQLLPWYSQVRPERTVGIVNDLHRQAAAGQRIFYDIYTAQEKRADPSKNDTGLFFFRGDEGARTAVLTAGGGFAYVAALQDSFPQAQELARRGFNAFALIYRPQAETGAQDLARAIAFLHEQAPELGIDISSYSLWGGSAGARLAAWLGSNGTAAYGEADLPPPAAVITQYTGLSEVGDAVPATYACLGSEDRIAAVASMRRRIDAIKAKGVPAQLEVFPGLGHGFGLGEGTVAEGWLEHAADFWAQQQ